VAGGVGKPFTPHALIKEPAARAPIPTINLRLDR
jgi:hypothetical protein